MEITRNPARTYSPESARIDFVLPDSGRRMDITVYGPDHFAPEARINWAGIGSVSSADAIAYASAIMLAASIAPTLAPELGEA